MFTRYLICLLAFAPASTALAQFGTPTPTNVRERIVGEFRNTTNAPVPEIGDSIGAFQGTQIIGRFDIEADGDREFDIVLYGDDPDTTTVEGPRRGQSVAFKYFDSSSNQTIDLTVLNNAGEVFNFTYQGEEVPPLPIPLPGLDLTPTRSFDLRVATDSDGGSGGDGGDNGVKYDVDGDGKISVEDAALVLRLVTGGGSAVPVEQRTRADVNGDGKVTTGDAVEILRNR